MSFIHLWKLAFDLTFIAFYVKFYVRSYKSNFSQASGGFDLN